MERIAIFPGSFDPFTIGHEEIVKRGLKMFDKIVIAVGINAVKRISWTWIPGLPSFVKFSKM